MKKKLVIIGNSGAARECYWLAQECIKHGSDFEFKGFLAFENFPPNLRELAKFDLGSDDEWLPADDEAFVIGIGSPQLRAKAFEKWQGRGANLVNLIHPNVHLIGQVQMGKGNIICCNSYLSCNSSIGDGNYLNGSVVLGHDAIIGDYNFFSPFTMVLGGAQIGNRNNFGIHSAALPGTRIGNDNKILPGAYIYKGCRNDKIMAGNPAVNIKD